MKSHRLRRRFEFGDRFRSEREGPRRARWRRYLDHLGRHGFDGRDAALMTLVGDVMHDSDLRVLVDAASDDVIIEGRNIFRRANPSRRLALRFRKCSALSVGWPSTDGGHEYFQSELHWPENGGIEVRIAIRDLRDRFGWICLLAEEVRVDGRGTLVAGRDYPTLASIRSASM